MAQVLPKAHDIPASRTVAGAVPRPELNGQEARFTPSGPGNGKHCGVREDLAALDRQMSAMRVRRASGDSNSPPRRFGARAGRVDHFSGQISGTGLGAHRPPGLLGTGTTAYPVFDCVNSRTSTRQFARCASWDSSDCDLSQFPVTAIVTPT